jgi:hypothetical protein
VTVVEKNFERRLEGIVIEFGVVGFIAAEGAQCVD